MVGVGQGPCGSEGPLCAGSGCTEKKRPDVFTDEIQTSQPGRQGTIAQELLSRGKGGGTGAENQVCWGTG